MGMRPVRSNKPSHRSRISIAWPLAVWLVAVPAYAQEHAASHEPHGEDAEHFHHNEAALFLGATYETEAEETFFTIGAEYERRFTRWFGLSGVVEYATDLDAWVVVFPVTFRLAGELKLSAGPGFEHVEEDNLFLFRFGAAYGFELGGGVVLSPAVDLDLVDEEEEVAESIVYGVALGIAF